MYYSAGNYEAYARPEKPEGADRKSAYIIGTGLAGLSAAFYLVRDGQLKGDRIHVLEKLDLAGGSCDGRKDVTKGFYMRGGREMDNHFECMWDLFRDVPSIETPGVSVLDEYYWLNKHDPNYSLCRATEKCGQDAHTDKLFALDKESALALSKLFITPEKDLEDKKISEVLPASFWKTNFWLYWQTMFAFQRWSSALEMKRYLCRYCHHIDGLPDFTALRFTKYNQYESMILPLVKYLESHGVKIEYGMDVKNVVIEEENGNPSADVWFGGTTDPYNESVAKGLLEPYEAKNASHLLGDMYRDKDGCWYGIYKGILGFMCNTEELERLGLEEPKDWDDLLKPEYKGLIWMSNPNTAGTAKLVINTMVQMKGHDEAMKYFVELDKNIAQYTKSGSGPSKKVGIGECVIGIGFLHDGITQILDGYDNISLVIPASGTSFEIGATAIFKGAKHPNAAKLWIEFALSPDCVNIAKENESFQFLVIDNAEQPEEATAFGLDPENVIDYDFEDAKNNTSKYVEDYFNALGAAADGRFQTE